MLNLSIFINLLSLIPSFQALALSNTLANSLDRLRQELVYSEPRYHASIAWALLPRAKQHPTPTDPDALCGSLATEKLDTYPTINHFPQRVVIDLNERFGKQLANPNVGSFLFDRLCVRIGKEVSSWSLKKRT